MRALVLIYSLTYKDWFLDSVCFGARDSVTIYWPLPGWDHFSFLLHNWLRIYLLFVHVVGSAVVLGTRWWSQFQPVLGPGPEFLDPVQLGPGPVLIIPDPIQLRSDRFLKNQLDTQLCSALVHVRRELGLWINRNRVDCEAICGSLCCWNDYEVLECDTCRSLPFYVIKMHYACECVILKKDISRVSK